MNWSWDSKKIYRVLTTVLLIGLLFHFVAVNILEFKMGITGKAMTVLSLWKELLIWVIWWYTIYKLSKNNYRSRIWKDKLFKRLIIGFIVLILATVAISFLNKSIGNYLVAFRYDFFSLWLFLLFYIIGRIQTRDEEKATFDKKDIEHIGLQTPSSITKTYFNIIKVLLWFGLIWYSILMTVPGVFKLIWYDRTVFEGQIGERPPAVYYSALNHGLPRNQFIFERPIFYGFFLVGMWPIFYLLYIRRQKFEYTWLWRFLYGANVISTFSRSAWGVWIVQTVILLLLSHRKHFWKYIKKLVVPLILIVGVLWYYFYYELFGTGRQFSNTWHINAFFKSLDILKEHRLLGQGAGTNGPASHQLGMWFNSENQYLQIRIEYGIIWFIIWLVYYGYLNISWWIKDGRGSISNYLTNKNIDNRDKQRLILIWSNIWLIWLSLCGLVLHSLGDKMSIWPLMILYWLRLWTRQK